VPYSATPVSTAVGRIQTRLDAQSRLALVGFLRAPRYEVLPTEDVEEQILKHVPREVTVTVTSSPRRGVEATLGLAERLARNGFTVVPHIAARLVRDEAHVKEILARVVAMGGRGVFVIAGDAQESVGNFPDSVALLMAMKAEPNGPSQFGVTGYPERHGFIEDDVTIQAMWDKRRLATYIVSNLCFDPRVVKKWVARVRRRGVELPIHIGMAGVADPAKLLRVSSKIGLTESARFLRGHSNWFLRMVQPGGYVPERFAAGLMPDLAAPERKVAGIHLFTFNEIEPTERWRQETMARLQA